MTQTQTRAKVEAVTPDIAADWLERNVHNRDIRSSVVAEYAGAMKRGEWRVNGEAIKFDENGNVLDGQHRLWAIIESGTTIDTFVIRGLDADVQETQDRGLKRSLADALKLRGEKNHIMLAAILVLKWRYDNNKLRTNERPSIPQALTTLKRHPKLRDDGVQAAQRMRTRFKIAQSVAGVAFYQFTKISREDAERFWDQLLTGENLQEGDAIYVLRRWLQTQNIRVAGRANPIMQFAMLIKAWNAWREGRFIQAISWRPTTGEEFPVPR